jgi:DNA (cytosine-5)-methyltransferase 1
MKALSLFSGIGGLDLAASRAGIRTVAMCEINKFCRRVLAARWPDAPVFEDIRDIRGDDFDETINVIHGGFPCQDLSVSGRREGLAGERSGLWFEMLRVVELYRPAFVVAENVGGAVNLALDTVKSGLEAAGYQVAAILLPVSAFGAPHERHRLGVVGVRRDVADSCGDRLQGDKLEESEWEQGAQSLHKQPVRCGDCLWPTPTVCGNHNRHGASPNAGDGLSTAVKMWAMPNAADCKGSHSVGSINPDWLECLMGYPIGWTNPECRGLTSWPGWPMGKGHEQYDYEPPRLTHERKFRASRVKAIGNAVVPQQFYPIFRAIAEAEAATNEAL